MKKIAQLTVKEREYIERLSRVTGYGKDVVRDIMNAQAEFLLDELKNGIPVRLGKIGEFEVVRKICRGGIDFRTGETGKPKMVHKIKFKPSRKFRMEVETREEICS